jgi:hypothetical protein
MSPVRFAVVFLGFAVFAGCSAQPKGAEEPEYALLQEVNDLLHSAAGATGRPPTKLADLDRYQSMYPHGYEAVKSGDVVVLWGGALKGEGESSKDDPVVAYQKAVPSDGGFVLLSGGAVKKMTAAEFGAAPKAGK